MRDSPCKGGQPNAPPDAWQSCGLAAAGGGAGELVVKPVITPTYIGSWWPVFTAMYCSRLSDWNNHNINSICQTFLNAKCFSKLNVHRFWQKPVLWTILNVSQIYPISRLDDITRFLTCWYIVFLSTHLGKRWRILEGFALFLRFLNSRGIWHCQKNITPKRDGWAS